MGWKALKTHFNITGHIVQVTDKGICIGSGYVHDLAVIDPTTGKVKIHETFASWGREYYPALLEATPEQLLALLAEEDQFEASVVVYTYEDGDILEKLCETPEWPNVTHDGLVMYRNKYSTDKAAIVARAKENAESYARMLQDALRDAERRLKDVQDAMTSNNAARAKLAAEYPDPASAAKPDNT